MLIRACTVLTVTCLATASLMAADSPLVGKWKHNLSKSQMTGLQEKIEDLGGGSYKFTFGDDAETYVLDGKPHPTRYGSTRTVTPEGTNQWKVETQRDGKTTDTSSWEISSDEQTFTSNGDATRADGSASHHAFKAKRVAGTAGLAGTWESTEVNNNAPQEWVIEPFGGDGLTLVFPEAKERDEVKFDEKDTSNVGPRVAPGATTAAKKTGERTVELTDKLKGKLQDVQHLESSEDGKTLTDTITFPGMDKTEVDVFDRE